MAVSEHTQTFKYEVGEEVVARLDGVKIVEMDGPALAAAALPAWTIGEITSRQPTASSLHYTIRFQLGDDRCLCVVSESAIEGTA